MSEEKELKWNQGLCLCWDSLIEGKYDLKKRGNVTSMSVKCITPKGMSAICSAAHHQVTSPGNAADRHPKSSSQIGWKEAEATGSKGREISLLCWAHGEALPSASGQQCGRFRRTRKEKIRCWVEWHVVCSHRALLCCLLGCRPALWAVFSNQRIFFPQPLDVFSFWVFLEGKNVRN